MKRYIILITVFILVNTGMALQAQQPPLYSQYTLNKYLYNPAIAGVDGYTTVNLLAKQSMMGFQDAPATFVLSAQTRILEDSYILKMLRVKKKENKASRSGRVGLGGGVFSDRNGYITKTGAQIAYAYHINFSNRYQISFGLALSAYQFKLNLQDAIILNPADPLLNSNKKSFFVPDANTGIFLLTDNYYAGASMSNLFGSYLKLGKDRSKDYSTPRYYYLLAGYKWFPAEKIKVEPSFLMQAAIDHFDVDINTTCYYNEQYWLGVSYRTSKALIFMVGASIKNFFFGYAYDYNLSDVRTYTSGSHELMIGMRFGDNDPRRAKWLHKDMKNFENK